MKMKKLFENWRKYLIVEGMKMPEDLPKGIFVTIEVDGDDHYVYYSNKNAVMLNTDSEVYGSIYFGPAGPKFDGICEKGMVISSTNDTTKGWGPLLYDVALEHSSMISNGLMSDRGQVSPDAYRIWNYYLKNRNGDVKWRQLDNPEDERTPGLPIDNCAQDAAEEAAEDNSYEWDSEENPLSKIFYKKDSTMINKLKIFDKLIDRR